MQEHLDQVSGGSNLICLENVRFRWARASLDVLDVESFQVPSGERVFVAGPSGSGKTTLLSLIGGVVTPQSGTVRILDTNLSNLGGPRRDLFRAAHIGFIFQMFNLIPYLPLLENVTLPCRFSPLRRERALSNSGSLADEARRLMSHLGLDVEALIGRPVTALSVGQQQRVAAARALIGRPELIVADEPTSSLDADTRASFLELLFNEVEAAAASLVFVSHDRSLESLFDRSVSLSDINRISERGGM